MEETVYRWLGRLSRWFEEEYTDGQRAEGKAGVEQVLIRSEVREGVTGVPELSRR